RNRIYVRASNQIRRISLLRKRKRRRKLRIARVIEHRQSNKCPTCKKTGLARFNISKRVLYDIHIGRFNLRRRIVEYHYRLFWCSACSSRFGAPRDFWPGSKFGRSLVAYLLYQAIELCIPMAVVRTGVNRLFGLELTETIVGNFKRRTARYYAATHESTLNRLRMGALLHIDETKVSVKGKTGYVWVLTNLHEVAYVYADTREAEFVHTLLHEFKGILVSDFYAAYDSFE